MQSRAQQGWKQSENQVWDGIQCGQTMDDNALPTLGVVEVERWNHGRKSSTVTHSER